MLESTEAPPAPPRDREWIGAFASIFLTCGLALCGFLLAGSRGASDSLALVGVVLLLFCGVITSLVSVLAGRMLVRRGWPRTARGARWAGTVAALMNVAVWIVALMMARRRFPPAPARMVSVRAPNDLGPERD